VGERGGRRVERRTKVYFEDDFIGPGDRGAIDGPTVQAILREINLQLKLWAGQ
jgi:hypothetical protein